MITSKQMLLGAALLFMQAHLHAADPSRLFEPHYLQNRLYEECALKIIKETKPDAYSQEQHREVLEFFDSGKTNLQDQIKNEPNGSDKREELLTIIDLCEQAKQKLLKEADPTDGHTP